VQIQNHSFLVACFKVQNCYTLECTKELSVPILVHSYNSPTLGSWIREKRWHKVS